LHLNTFKASTRAI